MEPVRQVAARLWKDEQGVSAIVMALSLTTVLGFSGLAVDAGLWYGDKRTLQGLADLAAWSAIQTYTAEGATTTAATDAQNAARAAVAASGVSGITVTVNNPPKSGSYTSSPSAFEVIITKPESLFFSAQYLKTVTVGSRAVSAYQITTSGGGAPGCMLALSGGPTAQILAQNNAQVNASTCGIYANGSSTSAVDVQGSANLKVDYLQVVGSTLTGNNGSITNSGATVTNGAVTADPYAGLTLSQIEASTNTTISCSSYAGTSESNWNPVAYTPPPGVYCGGLSVSNGNSMTLSPGVYYMVGGNFSLMSGTNTAPGVTIVMVPANGVNPTFAIGNGASLTMSSMTTGPTAGIAIYQDASDTGALSICGGSGGSTVAMNGTIYAPGAPLTIANGCTINSSSSNPTPCFEIIAGTINLEGGMGAGLTNCSNFGVKSISGTTSVTSVAMVE
jgi:Flp pilus assembly protein TadG